MPEIGMVKVFFSQADRRYGFMRVLDASGKPTGEEVFFHYDGGEFVTAGPQFSGSSVRSEDGILQRLNQPWKGDLLVFDRLCVAGRDRAQPWSYQDLWNDEKSSTYPKSSNQESGPFMSPQTNATTYEEMATAIREAKPGDKLDIVFANKTFNGDLRGRLLFVIMFANRGELYLSDLQMLNLMTVAQTEKWEGAREYIFSVCEGFDAEYFIKRTLGRELLDSVQLIKLQ